MPASKTPRKRYRPKAGPALPVLLRFSGKDARHLKMVPHLALAAIRNGSAVEADWHTLVCRLNWGIVLTRFPEYQGVQPDFDDALNAALALKARADRTGRWVATGDELKAIGEALAICDEMQDGTTRKDLLAALQQVFIENEQVKKQEQT